MPCAERKSEAGTTSMRAHLKKRYKFHSMPWDWYDFKQDSDNIAGIQEINDGSVDTGKQYSAALWVFLTIPAKR